MRSRVLRGGRGFAGPQGVGMGQENFLHHARWGEDRVRASPRLRPIRPLPRAPLLEKAPNLGANFFYFLYINIFGRY